MRSFPLPTSRLAAASLVLAGCLPRGSPSAQKSIPETASPEARVVIHDMIHGSPVDAQWREVAVSEAELIAFLGGPEAATDPQTPGADTQVASNDDTGQPAATGGAGEAGGPLADASGEPPLDEALVTGLALQAGPAAAASTPYMDTCRAAGVPIPPPWGDPAWTRLGALPPDRIFALDSRLATEAWSSRAASGTCVALPRMDGTTIFALGIVCQADTGATCFWDNIDTVTRAKITDPARIRPENLMDGSNLRENCTNCHRGDNAFIVHVGTILESIPNRAPSAVYAPIGAQAGWVNPAGDPALAVNCQSCHTVPALTADYCRTVLLKSIDGTSGTPTMPPRRPENYVTDVDALRVACRAL